MYHSHSTWATRSVLTDLQQNMLVDENLDDNNDVDYMQLVTVEKTMQNTVM
jgi:hypothetical protein